MAKPKAPKHNPSEGVHRDTNVARPEGGILAPHESPSREGFAGAPGIATPSAPLAGSPEVQPGSQLGKKGNKDHVAMGAPKPSRKATRKTPRSSKKALKAAHADKAKNQRKAPKQGG